MLSERGRGNNLITNIVPHIAYTTAEKKDGADYRCR